VTTISLDSSATVSSFAGAATVAVSARTVWAKAEVELSNRAAETPEARDKRMTIPLVDMAAG